MNFFEARRTKTLHASFLVWYTLFSINELSQKNPFAVEGGGAAPLKTAKEPGEKHRLEPYSDFSKKIINHKSVKFNWKTSAVMILITIIIGGGVYFSQYSRRFEKVAFEEIIPDDYCFPFRFYVGVPGYYRQKAGEQYIDEELVIQSEAEYSTLLEFRRRTSESCENIQSETYKDQCSLDKACDQKPLPAIDFSSKTLLGKYTHGSCSATGFERSLFKDAGNKTYLYNIKTDERFWANCRGPGLQSMNFITVPKIPNDYTVKFEPPISQRK